MYFHPGFKSACSEEKSFEQTRHLAWGRSINAKISQISYLKKQEDSQMKTLSTLMIVVTTKCSRSTSVKLFFDYKRRDNCGIDHPIEWPWLVVSETRTVTWIGTDIMQKPFTLAVSGSRTGHLKTIELPLEHTTWNNFKTWKMGTLPIRPCLFRFQSLFLSHKII